VARDDKVVTSQQHNDSLVDSNPGELYLINGILINEPYICDTNPYVIIFVHSAPQNTPHRTAIRKSWGSVAKNASFQTKVIFLLGVSSNDVTSREIHAESQRDHDVLQFNIEDAYKNLSLKSLAMLQWVEKFCSDVKYVVKVDDDTFLNTPLLISDLHAVVHTNFLMGDIIAGARPIRDHKSKYYTSMRQYRGSMYPTYLSGAAYVISGDVIPALTTAAKTTELFWLEDVYITGLLARRTRAKHIFNRKFGLRIQSISLCQFSRIIALHRISPNEMENGWILIKKEQQNCKHKL
jgi:beta-1,3-galactosyltransferase 1